MPGRDRLQRPIADHCDVDRAARDRVEEAVQLERRAIIYVRARPEGDGGCDVLGLLRRDVVADQERRAVPAVEPTVADAVIDLIVAQAGSSKLRPRDRTDLTSRDACGSGIRPEYLNNVRIPGGLLSFSATITENLNRVGGRRGLLRFAGVRAVVLHGGHGALRPAASPAGFAVL
jgi:hypothetical protein